MGIPEGAPPLHPTNFRAISPGSRFLSLRGRMDARPCAVTGRRCLWQTSPGKCISPVFHGGAGRGVPTQEGSRLGCEMEMRFREETQLALRCGLAEAKPGAAAWGRVTSTREADGWAGGWTRGPPCSARPTAGPTDPERAEGGGGEGTARRQRGPRSGNRPARPRGRRGAALQPRKVLRKREPGAAPMRFSLCKLLAGQETPEVLPPAGDDPTRVLSVSNAGTPTPGGLLGEALH